MSLRQTIIELLEDKDSRQAVVNLLADLMEQGVHGSLLVDKDGTLVYRPVRWILRKPELDDEF